MSFQIASRRGLTTVEAEFIVGKLSEYINYRHYNKPSCCQAVELLETVIRDDLISDKTCNKQAGVYYGLRYS